MLKYPPRTYRDVECTFSFDFVDETHRFDENHYRIWVDDKIAMNDTNLIATQDHGMWNLTYDDNSHVNEQCAIAMFGGMGEFHGALLMQEVLSRIPLISKESDIVFTDYGPFIADSKGRTWTVRSDYGVISVDTYEILSSYVESYVHELLENYHTEEITSNFGISEDELFELMDEYDNEYIKHVLSYRYVGFIRSIVDSQIEDRLNLLHSSYQEDISSMFLKK